jgi:hypothetical protein
MTAEQAAAYALASLRTIAGSADSDVSDADISANG